MGFYCAGCELPGATRPDESLHGSCVCDEESQKDSGAGQDCGERHSLCSGAVKYVSLKSK